MTRKKPTAMTATVMLVDLRRDDGGHLMHEDYGRIADNIDVILQELTALTLETARSEIGDVFTGETRTSWRLVGDDSLELRVSLRFDPEAGVEVEMNEEGGWS